MPENFYLPDEELSAKELKVGYWFTVHRLLFYKILLAVLIVFNVIFGGYSLFHWGEYLLAGYWNDQKMARELSQSAPLADFQKLFGARPLEVGAPMIFASRAAVDAVALARNPNERFFVSFEYRFDLGGLATPWRRGFLLPLEEKPLVELGIKDALGASAASLEWRQVDWQRISAHKIKNMAKYLAERLSFRADAVKFESGFGSNPARLTFDLHNDSNFSYYEPRFLILLESGGNLAGAEQVIFNKLLAGSKQKVELNLAGAPLSFTDIRAVPDINIFEEKAFLKP